MNLLRHLSPDQLQPDDLNPRATLDVDDLVSSIQTVGILQALLVVPLDPETSPETDPDHSGAERFRIVAGHRRHAAAVRLGLDTVPCLVAPDQGQADTLVKIVSENGVRRGLRPSEEADLFAQLALLDWAPEDIAAAVVQPVERVRGALTVHRLAGPARQQAWAAADQGTLDLAEAAALAEFDDPKTVERIISRGHGWGFSHAVAEERAKATKREATERLKAELVLAGVKVTTRPKDFGYGSKEAEASTLRDRDDNPVEAEQAKGRPGFAVFIDAQAATPSAVVYCTDPEAWGYTRTRPTSYVPPAVAAQREREQNERQAHCEALGVAAGVRRDFLAATWGTAKGARSLHLHVLRQAATDPHTLIPAPSETADALVRRLAGCELGAAARAGADRLTRILVARWLTAAETNLDDLVAGNRWRADDRAALAYLDHLTRSGYVLSDAEQRMHADLKVTTAEPDQDTDPQEDTEAEAEAETTPDDPEPPAQDVDVAVGDAERSAEDGTPPNGQDPASVPVEAAADL
ncbi:MAG: ParB/RepB/Spo0J family partition protein [Actinomycetales bacterium]|nr:ParB/RepB/Spo0J family partition protein [Actinomycetales bacterium]